MKDPVPLTPRRLGASLWTGPVTGHTRGPEAGAGTLGLCLAVMDG